MSFEDRPSADAPGFSETLLARTAVWFAEQLRPVAGWLALLGVVALAALPAFALDANEWTRLPETQVRLALTGAIGAVVAWWIMGWKRSARTIRFHHFTLIVAALSVVILGLAVVSQLTAGWLPGPRIVWESIQLRDSSHVAASMNAALGRTAARFAVWWAGARSGGAAPDEVVFSAFAGLLVWIGGAMTSALARRTENGFAASAPVLVLLGAVVFFGGSGRLLLVIALAIMLALHVTLDNQALTTRWAHRRLDSSSEILLERWFNAAAIGSAALLLGALAPSLSVDSVARLYARLVSPIDARIESARKEAFPNIQTAPHYSVAGTVTGLPNAFLLGAGPELDQTPILLLRTSDQPVSYDSPPPAPYLRATTLSRYDGRGWNEPDATRRAPLPANQRRMVAEAGRRSLAQTVRLYVPSRTLYAAGEPVEASVDAWQETDAQGELITMGTGAGQYAVVSAVPALDELALRSLPAWDEQNPLPAGFGQYLALPESVTSRTRELAAQITQGLELPYDQATALEGALRAYPYDIDIEAPPDGVDVADWFLFDLKRGYCDYYATAFVVMARALGLPARFATGYAAGDWLPDAREWRITAADSHAWPEVYFAGIGWIPFEPTASRPTLARVGAAQTSQPAAAQTTQGDAGARDAIDWNPQMLVWLLPIGLVAWGAWRGLRSWSARRADPWQAMLRWGERRGRPLQDGETPLEYAAELANIAEVHSQRQPRSADAARVVAREATALGRAVSAAHYAPIADRPDALREIGERWRQIQSALPRLRG